ncbi:DUF896 domain-containing protein [Ignavigranum ruoffiae]|uniref:DUF896 domain-containing protein n=1 Tax=Ignavigranum ruoffiae TaxID=89093 RepID=UPI0024ADF1C4|nr:DUF896 domain-containing protein [Ignavigranum ruoffiae]
MLEKEKMDRLNYLARKKKTESLTDAELKEQVSLRKEYLQAFRRGMRNHIEGIKIVDSEGNDLTSAKVKKIQKDKGLHRP